MGERRSRPLRQTGAVPDGLLVRPAREDDLPAIARIYAHYVTDTVVTFELEPPDVNRWCDRLRTLGAAGWPFLVGTVADVVVGYAYVAPWHDRPAYRYTVENSVYLAPGQQGRGYGRVLLDELLAAAAAAGAWQVVAQITATGSATSAAVHRAAGFVEVGRLSAVGFKQDRWLDVVLMQASLPARRTE